MKIAMIGGSGFVGTRLIDLLKEDSKNYECKNIDLLPSHFSMTSRLSVMSASKPRWTASSKELMS